MPAPIKTSNTAIDKKGNEKEFYNESVRTLLNHEDPLLPSFSPLYRQIKQMLILRLQQGEWQPGETIPSEMDLADRFHVSQGTIRKAIDELASENVLIRRQGVGTFVATHTNETVQYRFLKLMPDEQESISKSSSERKIIHFQETLANESVAQALKILAHEAVFCLSRVLSFAGVATILEEIWLPKHSFINLSAEKINNYHGPMYAFFETQFNVKMLRAEEKIKAVLPSLEQANHLKITVATPLLCVERTAYTYNNLPMEFRKGLYLTTHCHYKNELN
jgi:GntR family transcriptional regulator